MIKTTHWSKEHVVEGVKRVCENPLMKNQARQLDTYEFGVLLGESTQLIDNLFYSYQFPIKNIYGFDSFEGLPAEAEGVDRFYLFREGLFGNEKGSLSQLRPNGMYIKCWFNQLTSEHVKLYNMKPAAFVHVDGDLYISCIQSLTFMFENNLIIPGTVLGFDEFFCTETLQSGGESRAMLELTEKYKVHSKEFFRNIYKDSGNAQICWQNCLEIQSIGKESKLELMEE